jgi:putative redox protein
LIFLFKNIGYYLTCSLHPYYLDMRHPDHPVLTLVQASVTMNFISSYPIYTYGEENMAETVKAKVTLVNNMHFSGTATSGHTLLMDADDVSGGHNTGFRPMELLLVGFGGCSGMDVISILRKKRQPITGLEINVRGEKAESAPKIYKEVHIEYVVKGKGVEKVAVERAISLSLEKYCSVGATLAKAGTITHSYKIIEE